MPGEDPCLEIDLQSVFACLKNDANFSLGKFHFARLSSRTCFPADIHRWCALPSSGWLLASEDIPSTYSSYYGTRQGYEISKSCSLNTEIRTPRFSSLAGAVRW